MAIHRYKQDFEAYQKAHRDWGIQVQEQKANFKSTPTYLTYTKQVRKSEDARRALYDKEVKEWYERKDQRIAAYEAKYGDFPQAYP